MDLTKAEFDFHLGFLKAGKFELPPELLREKQLRASGLRDRRKRCPDFITPPPMPPYAREVVDL